MISNNVPASDLSLVINRLFSLANLSLTADNSSKLCFSLGNFSNITLRRVSVTFPELTVCSPGCTNSKNILLATNFSSLLRLSKTSLACFVKVPLIPPNFL